FSAPDTAAARSSAEVASYSQSAGPPMRNVVNGASGIPGRRRRASRNRSSSERVIVVGAAMCIERKGPPARAASTPRSVLGCTPGPYATLCSERRVPTVPLYKEGAIRTDQRRRRVVALASGMRRVFAWALLGAAALAVAAPAQGQRADLE